MLDEYPREWYCRLTIPRGYFIDPICDLCDIRNGTVRKRPCEMELCNKCHQKYLKWRGYENV